VLLVEVVAAEPEFAAVVVVDPSAPVVVGASVVVVDSVVVVSRSPDCGMLGSSPSSPHPATTIEAANTAATSRVLRRESTRVPLVCPGGADLLASR
jgi:hypothetical protein